MKVGSTTLYATIMYVYYKQNLTSDASKHREHRTMQGAGTYKI